MSQGNPFVSLNTNLTFPKLETVFERPSPSIQHQIDPDRQSKPTTSAPPTISQRRSLNLGLALKHFRPLSPGELVEHLQDPEIAVQMKPDHVANLLKHFPSDDEVFVLRPKVNDSQVKLIFLAAEDPAMLHDAELFIWHVARSDNLLLRLRLVVLKNEVEGEVCPLLTYS
jgi:hypothetical protein